MADTGDMTAANPITVKFENRIGDHMRAAQIYYRMTPYFIGDKIVAILLLLAGIIGIALAGVQWWFVLFILLALLEWFNPLSPFKLRAKLAFKQNPKYRQPYKLTFSDQGIHFITAGIDSHLDWSLYHCLLEDEQLFLLVSGKWIYTVIPKDAFACPGALDAFRELTLRMIDKSRTIAV